MQDLLASDLSGFLNEDLRAWLNMTWTTIEPLVGDFTHLLDVPMLAAFLAGAVAMMTGARLALAGVALLLMGNAIVQLGMIPAVPDWVAQTAVVLLILGAVQGLLTLVFGEQAAGTLIVAAVLGAILFVIWRGPAKALRLIGFALLRKGSR